VTADMRGGDLVTDLSEPGQVQAMIDAAWPLDVLVNAAGIYPATPLLEMTGEAWDRVQDINVRAPLLATVAFGRRCLEDQRTGCVVNISSGAALRARPGAAHYCTSKAALEMATRACALELGPRVRVNAVSPGYVEVASEVNPVTPEYAQAVSANPLGRVGTPEDIARAVLWLAGDDASWITGAVLRVDGGASAGAILPLHWPGMTDAQKGTKP
jgi:3-oxoacyl-[acyl-carrier protein] reductase